MGRGHERLGRELTGGSPAALDRLTTAGAQIGTAPVQTANRARFKRRGRMYEVSIRGESLVVPNMCCCCGDPKARKRYKAGAQRFGRWLSTSYVEKRWCVFPVCKPCDQWIRSHQAAADWFPTFLGSLILGAGAGAGAVAVPTFATIWGTIAALFAGAMLLVAVVAGVLWRVNRARARRLDPGPPCSWRPVVLTDWLRDKHTFEFVNRDYHDQFLKANRDSLA